MIVCYKSGFTRINAVVILLFSVITSCAQEESKEEKKHDAAAEQVTGGVSDSLLFDPYFSNAFFEGQAYYKPVFNEKYISARRIKSIHLKMIEFSTTKGIWRDFEMEKSFNFDETGKLISYFDYWTSDGTNDTSGMAYYTYENGFIRKQQVEFYLSPEEDYSLEYEYREKELLMTEYVNDKRGEYTVYVYDTDAKKGKNLREIKVFVRDTLRAVTVLREGKINEKEKEAIAETWVSQLKSPVFLMLYAVELKNGIPVYRVRLDKKGKDCNEDEDHWEYNSEGKLLSRSYKTISNKTKIDKFEYDKQGLIKLAHWGDKYKMEVSYTFY